MSLEWRIELAQRDNIFFGEKASEAEAEIEAGRLMSSGPDDAVAILPVGIVGIVVGNAQVKRCGDIHDRERAAGMARSCGAERDKVVAAHQVRLLFQFLDAVGAQNAASD